MIYVNNTGGIITNGNIPINTEYAQDYVLYIPFDRANGSADAKVSNDVSGGGNNMIWGSPIAPATAPDVFIRYDYDHNGKDSGATYISFYTGLTLNTVDCGQNFSIGLWVKGGSNSQQLAIYHRRTGQHQNVEFLFQYNGAVSIYVNAIGFTGTQRDDNVWTHIFMTVDGNTMNCYNNGNLVESLTNSVNITWSDQIRIDGNDAQLVADLLYYQRTLTDAEVWEIYRNT